MENGDDRRSSEDFQCSICLDILYKPVVLGCGHVSCFWCIHKSMNYLRESHCALCRHPYMYFPSICSLLHHLLMKIETVAYKRREEEVLEQENLLEYFSPQSIKRVSDEFNSKSEKKVYSNYSQGMKEVQVDVSDVICAGCKEILFLPAVLNCGHAYCRSCMAGLEIEKIKCQICESIHPGDFPKVCLDLDQYLKKNFPREYLRRRESFQTKEIQCQESQDAGQPSCTSLIDKNSKSRTRVSIQSRDGRVLSEEDLSNTHVGIGCDTCGMCPIVGKRYKCRDCKEVIGFDMCEECYNSSSKQPGRFNQQHTPEHVLMLDDSKKLGNILKLHDEIPEEQEDLLDASGDEVQSGSSMFDNHHEN